jgi:hypothetical protein
MNTKDPAQEFAERVAEVWTCLDIFPWTNDRRDLLVTLIADSLRDGGWHNGPDGYKFVDAFENAMRAGRLEWIR